MCSTTRAAVELPFAGTAFEWYDYFFFGIAAAFVLNRLFFGQDDPTAALLAALATLKRAGAFHTQESTRPRFW